MSSALDQSLDEILASKSKRQFKKKSISPSKVSKRSSTASKRKPQVKVVKDGSEKSNAAVLDASYATKVIVYGLPKDANQDSIKDFFASQIGGVNTVALTYNEKGQSKGIATVTFKSASHASEAVERYNGAPIDKGVSKLKLELVIDPTKKPLANRIVANAPIVSKNSVSKSKTGSKFAVSKSSKKPIKKTRPPKKTRPAKKTVEQLDQEMADYFDNKD